HYLRLCMIEPHPRLCYRRAITIREVTFMPDVLVRGLELDVLDVLKIRAKANNRSLQSELQTILTEAARKQTIDARQVAAKIRRELRGREHTDSAKLLREDRGR
ncbi:MAG TPA: Arc family DNA-binding protein, partial [Pyrinomonadaceae bacterium]